MRAIKFRAWDKKNKKMVDDVCIWGQAMIIEFGSCNHYKNPTRAWNGEAEYIYGPIMQYTGLKDRNRKEICEGDILSWKMEDGTEIQRDIVSWNESEACFDGAVNGWYHAKFYEVIGNIYENPELCNEHR